MSKSRRVAFATIALAASVAYAQGPPPPKQESPNAKHVSFVTCPIYRDAASQCWLAEHNGEVYYIGRYAMGSPPQLRHKVLVEGAVSEDARSCGGIVIEPVHVSNLPEVDNSCDTVLPDNGAKPTEVSRFDVPPEMLNLIGVELPMPVGPFADKVFVVGFDFGNTFLNQGNQRVVETAAKYAIASKAKHVTVTGFAAPVLLESGNTLIEPAELADQRARDVSRALANLGLQSSRITIEHSTQIKGADGIHDWQNRKVIVAVSGISTK